VKTVYPDFCDGRVCGASSGAALVFNESSQPGKRIVPLTGNGLEILPHLVERLRIELKEILATGVHATNNSRALQDPKVLGHGLSGKPCPSG
jgi:hypothetical protein